MRVKACGDRRKLTVLSRSLAHPVSLVSFRGFVGPWRVLGQGVGAQSGSMVREHRPNMLL